MNGGSTRRTVDVVAATPARWAELVSLFERPGPRGGTPITAGCWCRYWHTRGRAYTDGFGGANRRALEAEVRSASEPGLLALTGGEAVGWCRAGPRDSFPRLAASPKLAPVDDEDAWSLVCLYVHPAARRSGVARALLAGAVEHARRGGAPVLEAYAVRAGHPTIDAYTGHLPMFLDAGFEVAAERGRRTIVRRRLDAEGPRRARRTA